MKKYVNFIKNISINKKYITIIAVTIFTICFFLFDLGGLLGRILISIGNLISNVDGEVKQIVIKSDGYDENIGGSFKIIKSADWVDSENIILSYDVDTNMQASSKPRDIVILFDRYIGGGNSELQEIKDYTKEMISAVLDNSNNRISIISYETNAEILSGFTNDEASLINIIDNIQIGKERSFYQAFIQLETLLNTYQASNERDLIVVFIVTGKPGLQNTVHEAQYKVLKEKYPYMFVYGIDYNNLNLADGSISAISDKLIVPNNIDNPLLEPGLNPYYYETFEVIEYIDNDYFYIENTDDIEVSMGTTRIEEENGQKKIIWSADANEFRTGYKATMNLHLKLNSNLIKVEGLYPVSIKNVVNYSFNSSSIKTLENTENNILKNGYIVKYNSNLPNGCNIEFNLEEIYYSNEEVSLMDEKLACVGWEFQGWKTVEKVEKVNDDTFKMPNTNVEIRGNWSKLYLNKSLEGSIVSSTKTYVATYSFTGNYQTFEAPYTGKYKIELWGAEGGPNDISTMQKGGNGAYTSGEIVLNKGTKLFIYVGNYGYQPSNLTKPFNGGGAPDTTGIWESSHAGDYSGGGATDVRLVAGEWDNFDSLKSRIMVAAGGSGGNNSDGTQGGAGGGLIGITNSLASLVKVPTQTSGNAFGIGQSGGVYPNSYIASDGVEYMIGADTGPGGGGYYGGYRGYNHNSGGSSGTSFISGHDGCDAISSSSTSSNIIHTGQSIHYSGYQFTNTVMIDGEGHKWTTTRGSYIGMPSHDGTLTIVGNTGNGYAKITFLG